MKKSTLGVCAAGAGAGAIAGLLGAGGGMVLVPGLRLATDAGDREVFATSVAVMAPVCAIALWISGGHNPLPWRQALPYLLGGCLGGVAAGLWGRKIPTALLHKIFGILVLWGGIRSFF